MMTNYFFLCSYEPELHSGVIYKVEEFNATVTIHRTGRLIILAPSENSVKQAVEDVYPLVEPFQTKKPKKQGSYHNMVFRNGSKVSSLSILRTTKKGWHCTYCKFATFQRPNLKSHILKKHRPDFY